MDLPLPPPDVVPTARYRRVPQTEPFGDDEPTEPGTPPPPPSDWAAMGEGLL